MKNMSRILWGLVLIAIGIIWGLNSLDITNIDIFFEGWWTLFIIVPCAIGLFESGSSKSGNIIGLTIGVLLLLACQDVLQFELVWKLLLPVIAIVIGISLIFGSKVKTKVNEVVKKHEDERLEYIVATFGENNVDKSGEDFTGANVDAVFGGVKLDLKDAKLADESVIKATAVFGGIEIIVPKDTLVVVKSTPIFGGVSNKANTNKGSKKTIYIDAIALFGGIEIK